MPTHRTRVLTAIAVFAAILLGACHGTESGGGDDFPFETCFPASGVCLRGSLNYCQAGNECYFRAYGNGEERTFACDSCDSCDEGSVAADQWCNDVL